MLSYVETRRIHGRHNRLSADTQLRQKLILAYAYTMLQSSAYDNVIQVYDCKNVIFQRELKLSLMTTISQVCLMNGSVENRLLQIDYVDKLLAFDYTSET